MNDIRDRLLWRADSAGDGFHSDMIYRDALKYIDMLQIEIKRLRAALDVYACICPEGLCCEEPCGYIARVALAGEKTND